MRTTSATFLASFSILAFELFEIRTLPFLLGAHFAGIVLVVAALGQAAAGTWLASFPAARRFSTPGQRISLLALAATEALSLWASAGIQLRIARAMGELGSRGGLGAIAAGLNGLMPLAALALVVAITLPFLAFGFFANFLFWEARPGQLAGRYAADLCGAAAGTLVATGILEYGGFAASAWLAPAAALAAAGVGGLPNARARWGWGLFALGAVAAGYLLPTPEPVAQPNLGARDYEFHAAVDELWRGWNSYTRIGLYRLREPGAPEPRYRLTLGNGDGVADIVPYPQPVATAGGAIPSLVTALGMPRRVLVLFAGAGADMVWLHALTGGKAAITGVELNRELVAALGGFPQFGLGEFWRQPGVRLEVREARAFLESDPGTYDRILLSWGGATLAHYAGFLAMTNQFLYTREAIRALLAHLTPEGELVFLSTNKLNLLDGFRAALPEPPEVAARQALIFYQPQSPDHFWQMPWDQNPLLLKPSGFSPAEVTELTAVARRFGLEAAYSPDAPPPEGFAPYRDVLTSRDPAGAVARWGQRTGLRFGGVTDDRPFALNLFAPAAYLTGEFWRTVFHHFGVSRPWALYVQNGHQRNFGYGLPMEASRIFVFLALWAVSAVLLLVPLLALRAGRASRPGWRTAGYFAGTGLGFMLVEIGVMQQASLLLEYPGLAIAVVLGALLASSGLGAALPRPVSAVGAAGRICLLAGLLALAARYGLAWPLGIKCAYVAGAIAPVGLVIGRFFPAGLRAVAEADPRLVPWGWGLNGIAATLATAIAPSLVAGLGFRALTVLAAFVYLPLARWFPGKGAR